MNTQKSKHLFERAKKLFPGGVNSPVRAFKSVGGEPFIVSHGQGPYLFDVDGNRYVDYINSWGPLVLGHAHPAVVDAIARQAERGTSYGACCELEAELAEEIQRWFPRIEMLRFVNSGTEAGMSVLRLARAYTKRNKVIKFSGCYHGHCDAMLVQAGSGLATLGIPDSAGVMEVITRDTITVPYNDIESFKRVMHQHAAEIAAVIVEPVVGNAGFIAPQNGFLQELRAQTLATGALLIFDEVMTGFRVHRGGAQALFDISPDLSMLGKVIGGGLPVGAFGGKREIMSMLAPLGAVYQAGTLSGNPLAMAAGLTTLRAWTKAGVFEQVESDTLSLVAELKHLSTQAHIPLSADCRGTMFGYFFQAGPVQNYEQAKNSDLERFKRFFHDLLNAGVYFAPSQFEAGFVSSAHHGEALQYTFDALKKVFAEL